MPRNHNPGTLRNRNRITPKTRLRIHVGELDADPVVLEEDEEKARVVSTAGVDAEDANEHHLQVALTAASHRHHPSVLQPRPGAQSSKPQPTEAYIPVPDSTGVAADYAKFYPADQWKDPTSYVRSSDTVEEVVEGALHGGFTYLMDERDAEWLEKNNEEARGEGTSAQGAVSNGAARARLAKGKGKEPDTPQPVPMSEDEFELVMGLFEKTTHEKTEHLHLSLETNMAFPAFSEYEPVFSADLTPAFFATFTVPSWIPPTTQMLKFARAVYPYWRERRLDRRGHRIIPVLNYDESDTKNESYVCFRRREVKTVRKTRASQVSYTDKLLRMQAEHELALGVATLLVQRETLKKDAIDAGLAVWQRRAALMDLRRKAPHLATKEDDELFIDKEVVRKPKDPIIRPPHPPRRPPGPGEASPIVPPIETFVRPRERYLQVQAQIEKELAEAKLREKDWEDVIDRPYQPRPVPYGERLFKYLHGSSNSKTAIPDQHGQRERHPVALRLRFGRGGRMHLDRRRPSLPPIRQLPTLTFEESEDEDMDDATRARLDVEIEESRQRQQERWKFDEDDGPAVGPLGSEEHDRVLYDDYQPRHIAYTATLLKDQDHLALQVDQTVNVMDQGRIKTVVPPAITTARELALAMRNARPAAVMGPPAHAASHSGAGPIPASVANGIAIATLKKMQPPMQPPSLMQMRMPSNGGLRPPSAVSQMHPAMANGLPVVGSPTKSPLPGHAMADGVPQVDGDSALMAVDGLTPQGTPVRPKSVALPNPYPLGNVNMNGFPAPMTNAATYIAHAGHNGAPPASDMKSAFGLQDFAALQPHGARPGFPPQIAPNGTNYNLSGFHLQLPPSRQTQRAAAGVGSSRLSGAPGEPLPNGSSPPSAMSPAQAQQALLLASGYHVPTRTPSAGSMRSVGGPPGAQMMQGRASPAQQMQFATAHAHARSPHMAAAAVSPLPLGLTRSPHHAPHASPRAGPSPVPPSPSLPTVNGTNGAY